MDSVHIEYLNAASEHAEKLILCLNFESYKLHELSKVFL